jgi:mRNA interferase RelE/StbE|tara:strand:+ start:222 stop:578 length:357 start_codon:yes stop_codon:yes gene_type:complete
MYEVSFSDQSMSVLNQMDHIEQMKIVETITNLNSYQLKNPDENVGVFKREGKDFYRIRTGDIRIYFEARGKNQLYSHFILHKNTMADFMFRCKLPLDNESAAEQDKGFWKYLEGLTRK